MTIEKHEPSEEAFKKMKEELIKEINALEINDEFIFYCIAIFRKLTI